MRAVAYTRVSTTGQTGPDKVSLQNQLDHIRRYCEYKQWELVKVYDENAASGAKLERPVLQRLLDDSADGKFEAAIVADLSRFGRNTLHLKQNLEILKKNNVSFTSLKESISTENNSATGELIINILASIYEFERETILQRTSENKLIRWRDRKIFVGHPPYCYYWRKETVSVEIDEKEKETYLHIVSQYLDFDKSLSAICMDLNTNKVPTRRRKLWAVPVISRMLKHSCYWTGTLITNQGKEVKDQIDYECEPLLSKARWEAVQQRLDSNKTRSGRPSKAEDSFLLYKLLKCGLCGSSLLGHYDTHVRADGSVYRYYSCYWHHRTRPEEGRGRERCILPIISAAEIEKLVWDRLLLTLSLNVDKTKLIDNAQWEQKEARVQHRIAELETALRGTTMAIDKLVDGLKQPGDFDFEAFRQIHAKFDAERTQQQLELREAREELNNLRQMRLEEEKLIQFAKDRADLIKQVRDVLKDLPFKEQQRCIKGMLSQKIEIGLLPDLDWMEDEDADPPEQLKYMHWSESVFIPFRFNWPLLQDILSKHLPPGSGGSDGNGNLCPHRSAGRALRGPPLHPARRAFSLHPRAGHRRKASAARALLRRWNLCQRPDETQAHQEALQIG